MPNNYKDTKKQQCKKEKYRRRKKKVNKSEKIPIEKRAGQHSLHNYIYRTKSKQKQIK